MMLWDHQRQAVNFISEKTIKASRRCLICMPPGAGKSEVAIVAVLDWLRMSRQNRAVFCVPGNRVLGQFYTRISQLTRETIDFEQGKRRPSRHARLILASQLSLVDRLETHDDASLVVIDEAHHSSYDAPTFNRVAARYSRVIGLTATPWTNGLVRLFDSVNFYSLSQAVKDHVVCPVNIIRAKSLDLRLPRHTPVFVSTNEQAQRMSKLLPNSDWVGHSRSDSANFAALNRWKAGITSPLFVNRMLLEGYDLPDIENVWIDMEMESCLMCAQVMGRAMRYRQGKEARVYVLSDRTEQTAHKALHMLDSFPAQVGGVFSKNISEKC